MRSVYDQQLKEEGFEIQFLGKNQEKETAIRLSDFYAALNYSRDDSTQMAEIAPNQTDVAILYSGEKPDLDYQALNDDTPKEFQLSVIKIAPNQSIGIEQNGYFFDQDDITLSGYWIWDKIADMVPYDYVPQ